MRSQDSVSETEKETLEEEEKKQEEEKEEEKGKEEEEKAESKETEFLQVLNLMSSVTTFTSTRLHFNDH